MRKITLKSLENAAFYYLQRFSSSEGNLRQVLERKVTKHTFKTGDSAPDETSQWIDAVVHKCRELGYVNDQVYADGKVQGFLVRGKSLKYIRDYLRAKKLSNDTVEASIAAYFSDEEMDQEDYVFEAAIKHARKKRIGPYRAKALPQDYSEKQKMLQKEIGSMARAGFPIEIALKVIHN